MPPRCPDATQMEPSPRQQEASTLLLIYTQKNNSTPTGTHGKYEVEGEEKKFDAIVTATHLHCYLILF
ncbi:hypothetical protein RUM43_005713 [Polyplax serrata]|uniref:Uncharacterized protein n=1 Tax=Polyplax serrata TaxID=468196 RepID=A0AAN8PBL4_POLSC